MSQPQGAQGDDPPVSGNNASASRAVRQMAAKMGVAPTKLQQDMQERVENVVALPQRILMVMTVVQLGAIYLPTMAITSASGNMETTAAAIRFLCLLISFLVAATSWVKLVHLQPEEVFASLQQFMFLRFLCLVLDFSLFALEEGYLALLIFGLIALVMNVVQLGLAFSTVLKLEQKEPSTLEFYYTKFVCPQYDDGLEVERVKSESMVRHLEANDLMSKAKEIAKNVVKEYGSMHLPQGGSAELESASAEAAGPPSAKATHGYANRMIAWVKANQIRTALYKENCKSHNIIMTVLLVLFVLLVVSIAFEFSKIFVNQDPIFDANINNKYRGGDRMTYFPTRTHNTWKVHLVVMDGLRYDHTDPGASSLGDYFASPAFAPFSMRFKTTNQIPTFSVPNWMSILTGAPPENHGVTGNLLAEETKFDTIFHQLKSFGLHGGISGTPWWRDLVFSQLPPLDGDGTVDASFVPVGWPEYEWETSDPADSQRLANSLQAVTRSKIAFPFGPTGPANLYDFFLTHFSDIDKQGHEYGIDKEWNTRDSYFGAITNKTLALQQIVAELDAQTVLIVTSDHGHVNRGGHGGISDELKEVPVVFYAKNRLMTNPAPIAFTAADEPRQGTYTNLDVSATVCAILGIPSPRQSIGIFIEEAIREFVPVNVQILHYHDLFMAKRSVVEQYAEKLILWRWNQDNNTDWGAFSHPLVRSLAYGAPGAGTPREYGDAIRELLPDYWMLRNFRMVYVWVRNLVCGLILLCPLVVFLLYVFQKSTLADLSSLQTPDNMPDEIKELKALTLRTFVQAFVSVALYIALSLAAFAIAYMPIIGYNVWDSTITHTPSVATTFIVNTVITPIFIFLVITRVILAPTFDWYTPLIILDIKAKNPRPLYWISFIAKDIWSFCVAPLNYKDDKFHIARTYTLYLALWTAVFVALLLVLSVPYAFIIPIVMSSSHFTDFNLQWRFRILTVQIMTCPLMIGALVLLHSRPSLNASTDALWDATFAKTLMPKHLRKLMRLSEGSPEAMESPTVEERKGFLKKAAAIITDPDLQYQATELDRAGLWLKKNE